MIKSVEGLRGLAAIIVALYHLKIGADYSALIRNGYLFVDLFFVLSGFVMCAAYAGRLRTPGDLVPFMIRRTGRLLPLLLFSTVVFVLGVNGIVFAKQLAVSAGYNGVLNSPGDLTYQIPTVAQILATLTFTHALGIFDELILNTPTWSISTEFYTYFLFAAVCLYLRGYARAAAFSLLSIFGLMISAWASVNIHDCLAIRGCLSLTYDFGFTRCVYSFFLGGLAWYSTRHLRINVLALQITALFGLSMLLLFVDRVPTAAFAFPVAFAALILSIHSDRGPLSELLKAPLFQNLGERSYSVYLMHMPLLLIFANLTKRSTGFVTSSLILVAYLVMLYVISGWTYRRIENPARAWFNAAATRSAAARRGELGL